MAWLNGKFTWYDHVSNDIDAASAFYGALFGWTAQDVPLAAGGSYRMIMNGAEAIGGFVPAPDGMPNHWNPYLSVADVDAALVRTVAAGATLLMPATEFAPWGWAATITDPAGAVLSLWRGTAGDRPDVAECPHGDWYWTELMAGDAEAELSYYERLFGYTHDTMQLGTGGPYYVLKAGDRARAGIMRAPESGTPAAWLGYVSVGDCDATLASGGRRGARAVVPPTEIPGIGRFAVLRDPFGATTGVITPLTRR